MTKKRRGLIYCGIAILAIMFIPFIPIVHGNGLGFLHPSPGAGATANVWTGFYSLFNFMYMMFSSTYRTHYFFSIASIIVLCIAVALIISGIIALSRKTVKEREKHENNKS